MFCRLSFAFAGRREGRQPAQGAARLLERMGDVNLTAIEESEELQKTLRFSHQPEDRPRIGYRATGIGHRENQPGLAQALPRGLRRSQCQIPRVFPHLFRGGAPPRSHRRERPARDRVEIVANPPGKRFLQNIELLSAARRHSPRRLLSPSSWSSHRRSASSTSGCAAGRSQRGPLQRSRARDDGPFAVHHRHTQSTHDGDRRPSVRVTMEEPASQNWSRSTFGPYASRRRRCPETWPA